MSVAWATFIVTTAQAILLTIFLIGRWVGKQERGVADHQTPVPVNLTQSELDLRDEIKRCRDRLHNLEGFRQSLFSQMEDRHPTRREYEGLERRVSEDRRNAHDDR